MDYRIQSALKVIESDVRVAPGPRQIASRLGLSVSRFYELFRQETGTVPATYIRRLRFEKARELLEESELSVKQISGLVGIQDLSHFVRTFRKQYGMSPKFFRRAHRCSSPETDRSSSRLFTGKTANKP